MPEDKNKKPVENGAESGNKETPADNKGQEAMTVFGKIDRRIIKARNDKAAKKAKKEKEKADKAASKAGTTDEKKKFPWKTVAIVGSSILVGGGAALLGKELIDERDEYYELDEDSCALEDAAPEALPAPEPVIDDSVDEAEKIPA